MVRSTVVVAPAPGIVALLGTTPMVRGDCAPTGIAASGSTSSNASKPTTLRINPHPIQSLTKATFLSVINSSPTYAT